MYLFEDAELKTIFNMAELVIELEPVNVIDQENKDPNAGEEKREIISQNGNFIFRSLFKSNSFIVSDLTFYVWCLLLVSLCPCPWYQCQCKCLDHVENVPCQGHQLPHHLLWGLHLQLRGQHRVCGGADPTSSGQFSQLACNII